MLQSCVEAPGEKPFPCTFQLLDAAWHFFPPHGPLPFSKPATELSFSYNVLSLVLPLYKDPCDGIGLTSVILLYFFFIYIYIYFFLKFFIEVYS